MDYVGYSARSPRFLPFCTLNASLHQQSLTEQASGFLFLKDVAFIFGLCGGLQDTEYSFPTLLSCAGPMQHRKLLGAGCEIPLLPATIYPVDACGCLPFSSTQLNSAQLNSVQVSSTQLNSAAIQFSSVLTPSPNGIMLAGSVPPYVNGRFSPEHLTNWL